MAAPTGSPFQVTALPNANRPAPAAEVRAGVALLRERHRQGRDLARRFPVGPEGQGRPVLRAAYSAWGAGAFEKEAERKKVTTGELFSRRRFYLAYSAEDLRVLLDRRTPSGMPLSWSVVRWLVRMQDRRRRASLERKAAERGWTVAEVRAEIKAMTGQAHGGGRPVRPPKSLEAGLVAVTAEAERLCKLLEAVVLSEGSAVGRQRRRPGSDDGRVAALAAEAEAALRELRRVAARATSAIGRPGL